MQINQHTQINSSSLATSRISRAIALSLCKMLGWKIVIDPPLPPKFVLIGAPHTSNWDLLYALLLMHGASLKFNFVSKDSLFRWPLGPILRWLGAIPVNRRSRSNFVQQTAEVFNNHTSLIIAIAPEGTREKVGYWKTGFYYLALTAGVPLGLGFIDYGRKEVGIGAMLTPSGDLQADFKLLSQFYADKTGKYPHQQGIIQPKPVENLSGDIQDEWKPGQ